MKELEQGVGIYLRKDYKIYFLLSLKVETYTNKLKHILVVLAQLSMVSKLLQDEM